MTAKCSSSAPGLRDKNNPIYMAPAVTSSAKHPGRAWKKQLFRLTGGSLGNEGVAAASTSGHAVEGRGAETVRWKTGEGRNVSLKMKFSIPAIEVTWSMEDPLS